VQVLLMVQRTQRELPGYEGPREEATQDKGTLKVSSCQAYDYLLLAALKAQVGNSKMNNASVSYSVHLPVLVNIRQPCLGAV
jgi:hypothetical protein